ncbi:MAG TPA: hypothetical protein H9748_01880 [Candidatus Mediterraneibacter norwichensis]|nr:hypothetical protein [Candidatus Mediterraneibacter norwichensis]
MQMAYTNTIVFIILFLGIAGGMVALEIFLARSEKSWPGLIPPAFTFLWTLISCLNVAAAGDILSVVGALFITLLVMNVPTLILLAVYFVCREKRRKKKQLDKMNIQDLS